MLRGSFCRIARRGVSCSRESTKRLFSQEVHVPYDHGLHRSNAEELISRVKPIVVDGHVAVCDGGGGALGHPLEYIQLDTVKDKPQTCKYCGLRYVKGEVHHH